VERGWRRSARARHDPAPLLSYLGLPPFQPRPNVLRPQQAPRGQGRRRRPRAARAEQGARLAGRDARRARARRGRALGRPPFEPGAVAAAGHLLV